jgi:hypothetical protein
VPVLAGDALGHRHALFLGLVRQHRAAHHVAHRPDAGQVGAAVGVDHDGATLVELQAHGFGVQPVVLGTRPIETISLSTSSVLRLALGVGVGHTDALLAGLDLPDLHAQLDLQALLGEGLLRFLGNLFVHRAQEGGQASSTVTSAPRRRQTEPISRPMTPEPIRPSFLGTAPMRSAPSLDSMFSSSKACPAARVRSIRWPR